MTLNNILRQKSTWDVYYFAYILLLLKYYKSHNYANNYHLYLHVYLLYYIMLLCLHYVFFLNALKNNTLVIPLIIEQIYFIINGKTNKIIEKLLSLTADKLFCTTNFL